MHRLDGRIAIITGGGSGIGRATAILFAEQGATVVLVGRRANVLESVVDEIKELGGNAIAMPGDTTLPETAEKICKDTYDKFGRIDILVNSAGAGDYTRPITAVTNEFWHHIISVDQDAVFYFCREVLKYMVPADKGCIVNVSSVGGVFCNSGIAYAAAKSAVVAMTHNMGIQFAGTGIRVNAVCPGGTDTPMLDEMQDKSKFLPEDIEMGIRSGRHCNGTLPRCEAIDQAQTILFLVSDEAKGIQGQYIVVDNGSWL